MHRVLNKLSLCRKKKASEWQSLTKIKSNLLSLFNTFASTNEVNRKHF